MSGLPDAKELFAQSLAEFHTALPIKLSQELKHNLSKDDMLKEVKALCSKTKDSARLSICCTKVAKFAGVFAPYFDVINIFVQAKAEYMAVVWGSIKLIFVLATNHVTFLEKVAGMFESLSVALPQFQELYESCASRRNRVDSSQRLLRLLKLIYEDVVAFCGEVILTLVPRKQEHRLRRNLRLFRDTVWTTFDGRFGKLLDRMKTHQDLFSNEILIQDRQWLEQQFRNFEATHQSSDLRNQAREEAMLKRNAVERLQALKAWIWSSSHNITYEKAIRTRQPDSCNWLLSKDRYLRWRDRQFNLEALQTETSQHRSWLDGLLFLQAKPGFGKTTLSTAIIDDLVTNVRQSTTAGADAPGIAYFHFDASSRSGARTTGEALRSLAVQLITNHQTEPSLMDALSVLFDERSIQQRASTDDAEAVIKILLQQYPTYMVIDGMDECINYDELLSRMSNLLMLFDCRVLVLSRPDITFPWTYKVRQNSSWLAQLSALDNQRGISQYVKEQLDMAKEEGLFGTHTLDQELPQTLAKRSQGMFLWASVFIKYVRCPALTPNERCLALENNNVLQDLAELYNKILEALTRTAYEKQIKVAADIIRWVAMPLYAMESKALQTAVAIIPGEPTDRGQLLANWPRCIQQITCSLVEVDGEGLISFLHLSFREFVEQDPRCHSRFSLRNTEMVHQTMAMECLSYLVRDIPERPLQGVEKDPPRDANPSIFGSAVQNEGLSQPGESRSQIMATYPFLKYASLCWIVHLERAMAQRSTRRWAHLRDTDANNTRHTASSNASRRPNLGSVHQRCEDELEDPGEGRRVRRRIGDVETDDMSTASQAPNALYPRTSLNDRIDTIPDWTTLLAEFLIRPLLVNVWVEMCSTFGHFPNLEPLEKHLREACEQQQMLDTTKGRELWWIHLGIRRLFWAFRDLRRNHAALLKLNPTLIWQEQISAATDPRFWPNWDEDHMDGLTESQAGITVRAGTDPRQDGMSAGAEFTTTVLINYL